jgi:hypothetical protein
MPLPNCRPCTSERYGTCPQPEHRKDMTLTTMITVRKDDLHAVMARAGAREWDPTADPDFAEVWQRLSEAKDPGEPAAAESPGPPSGGQFMFIAFAGHTELTGYVTEVTIGGKPAFHIDLPEKLWGGNPLAWEEYSADFLFSRHPVTQESVRAAWDAQLRRAAERARWQEDWQQERAALPAGARAADPACICGSDSTGEDIDANPGCLMHGYPF